jgi:hypothetical protein
LTKEVLNRPDLEYRLWNAHREGQYSTHVIFDIWFKTALHCTVTALSIRDRSSPILVDIIDDKVYVTGEGRRQIRMPYSFKHTKTGGPAFPLILPSDQVGGDFSVEDFLKSLVTVYHKGPPEEEPITYVQDLKDYPLVECDLDRLLNQRTSQGTYSLTDPDQEDRVVEWIRKQMNGKRLYRKAHTTWHISPGVYCDLKGDRHVENKSYFHLVSKKRGYFVCTKCKVSRDCEVDFVHVMKDEIEFGDELLGYTKLAQIKTANRQNRRLHK